MSSLAHSSVPLLRCYSLFSPQPTHLLRSGTRYRRPMQSLAVAISINYGSNSSVGIDEYYQGLTTRYDQLALLGKAIDHEDQIEQLLEGLPEDYKIIVDQTAARDTRPSLTELHEKLINHEMKLQLLKSTISSVHVTANYANQRGSSGQNNNGHNRNQNSRRGGYRDNQTWQPQQQQFQAPTTQTAGRGGYQGRCQLCGVFGHSARRCSQLATQGASFSQSVSSQTPWQPQENVAHANPYTPNQWILDSGATHYLTSDLSNLALHQPYNGGEEVAIADGSGLAITHTGSTSFSMPSKSLKLTDILCVPTVNKNLISVYRLCNANRVSVEFFPAHFQAKDLKSGVRLLQARTRNDLYEWPWQSLNPTACLASYPDNKATLNQWHRRLATPLPLFLKQLSLSFLYLVYNIL